MAESNGKIETIPEEEPVQVRMRGGRQPLAENTNASVTTALMRGMDALHEGETTEETEEIRKLDTQLDHLNDYMTKVEERIKAHNQKLMETLAHQKQERERRRQSFHERMQTNQSEDDEFSRQMAAILNRVQNTNRGAGNRTSVYDFINGVDVSKNAAV